MPPALRDEENERPVLWFIGSNHFTLFIVVGKFGFKICATRYGLREYDVKGQCIPIPFAIYGGNLLGRGFSAWLTGRWAAPLRETSLGNLSARNFYSHGDLC